MTCSARLISVIIAMLPAMVAISTVTAKLLGDRIADLGVRVGGVETRMNAIEGAPRDLGDRMTA